MFEGYQKRPLPDKLIDPVVESLHCMNTAEAMQKLYDIMGYLNSEAVKQTFSNSTLNYIVLFSIEQVSRKNIFLFTKLKLALEQINGLPPLVQVFFYSQES